MDAATSNAHAFRVRLTHLSDVTAVFDAAEVAARCPEGFAQRHGVVLTSKGSAELVSDLSDDPLTLVVDDAHCSLATPSGEGQNVSAVEMEGGLMVLRTRDGASELRLRYRAPGVIVGDLLIEKPGDTNTHTFRGPLTVAGGTGVFEGASGDGELNGKVTATYSSEVPLIGDLSADWEAAGTLVLPDRHA